MTLGDFIVATRANGGCSFNPFTGASNPTTGYMVAARKDLEGVYNNTEDGLIEIVDPVRNYIASSIFKISLLGPKNLWLGSWVNNGKLYLDWSLRFIDKDRALNYATSEDQLAIWDCENQRSIILGERVEYEAVLELNDGRKFPASTYATSVEEAREDLERLNLDCQVHSVAKVGE